MIAHGIYDSQQNRGYITLGNSKDTSEFACESLKRWWKNYGKSTYPNANSIGSIPILQVDKSMIKCSAFGKSQNLASSKNMFESQSAILEELKNRVSQELE